jgi:hypothetical protein
MLKPLEAVVARLLRVVQAAAALLVKRARKTHKDTDNFLAGILTG